MDPNMLQFIFDFLFYDTEEHEERNEVVKIYNYAEEIIPTFSHNQFRFHFRMHADTFEELARRICETSNYKQKIKGNPEIQLNKQIMVTLWYLSNLETFRSIADRFGISKSTAWKCVYRICEKIVRMNREGKIISWPNHDILTENMASFRRRGRFPGVVGAIDGSHIPIKAPQDHQTSYINRKGFHSILLQVVCDADTKFLDVYCGEAGSIHDACLFRRSHIGRNIHTLNLLNGHLVGDAAYPLSENLMVPFKNNGHLTEIENNYNSLHSKARVIVEQALGILKQRFRRLKLIENMRFDIIVQIIMSICILHNVCLSRGDVLNFDEAQIEEERILEGNNNIHHLNNAGVGKRRAIANDLYFNQLVE